MIDPYREPGRFYLVVVWLMPLAVLSQIGLAFFGVPIPVHGALGLIVGMLGLLLIWCMRTTDASRSQRALACILVGLIGLQPFLLLLGAASSVLAAVHGINALVILGLASALALDSEDTVTRSRAQSGMASPNPQRPPAVQSERQADCRRL